jgi:hypothetical protein
VALTTLALYAFKHSMASIPEPKQIAKLSSISKGERSVYICTSLKINEHTPVDSLKSLLDMPTGV